MPTDDNTWSLPRFKGSYESHYQRLNPLNRESFNRSADSYWRLYNKFLPQDRGARILDLGCGVGHFLFFLEKLGFRNYVGVEQSKEFTQFIDRNITPKVVTGDAFEFVKETKETFDLIVMNDFVEHVPKERLRPFLNQIHHICGANGRVLIKTPNMTYPLSGWSRHMDFTHEVGFTEESIQYLLELSGFGTVDIYPAGPEGVNRILRLVMWPFLRLLGRRSPKVVTPNLIAVAGF